MPTRTEDGSKQCSKCLNVYSSGEVESAFSRHRTKDGFHYNCKTCRAASHRKWVQDNPKKAKESRGKTYSKHREQYLESAKEYGLLRRTGCTIEQRDVMFTNQEGKCGICGKSNVTLVVDHCHKTDKIRGLLCNPCNLAIGLLNDNSDLLQRAASWVSSFQNIGLLKDKEALWYGSV